MILLLKIGRICSMHVEGLGTLGVQVICLNEENLITPCVDNLKKVFPQVEVIDLGSQDSTLDQLKQLNVPVHIERVTAEEYIPMKNEYAKKYDWLFTVDGDEVYPIENLELLKSYWLSKKYKAYRISWRNMVYRDGKIYLASPHHSGPKLYKPGRFQFVGQWPHESVAGNFRREEPKGYNGVWCWHGKALNRSSIPEDPLRKKKREEFPNELKHKHKVEWEILDRWPWDTPSKGLEIDVWEGKWEKLESEGQYS